MVEANRRENLNILFSLSYKLNDRVKKCCKSIKISPTANSTAEKIKKKKVHERRFKLS